MVGTWWSILPARAMKPLAGPLAIGVAVVVTAVEIGVGIGVGTAAVVVVIAAVDHAATGPVAGVPAAAAVAAATGTTGKFLRFNFN